MYAACRALSILFSGLRRTCGRPCLGIIHSKKFASVMLNNTLLFLRVNNKVATKATNESERFLIFRGQYRGIRKGTCVYTYARICPSYSPVFHPAGRVTYSPFTDIAERSSREGTRRITAAVIAMITKAPGCRVYVRTVYAFRASAVYRLLYGSRERFGSGDSLTRGKEC